MRRRPLLALPFSLLAAPAVAQEARTIRVIMPLAAGSAVDVMVRIVAERMGEILGQRLVVENVTGASGMIGMRNGARAPADGSVLVAVNDAVMTMLPNMSADAGYDPLRDFAPIGQVARIRWALVAHAGFAARDVAGLIAAARARPGQIDYASGGPGSPQHVAMEMFQQAAGVRLNHIGYRGATPALNAVAAGECPVGFFGLPTPVQLAEAARVRILATAGPQRVETLRDIPTLAESGLPGFSFHTWGAFLAPAGTPAPVVARLNAALRESLGTPAVRDRLENLAYEVVGNTPEDFAQALARDHAAMGTLIRTANIRAD
ncbi:Bug family tripartite tricarboxylate transporter substrate binding protein [Falsiroseomonas oryziterrae]|uniref:Bug family tripartite tricarboxylate transporter substrate binding protein n=1 Tax=Falsiroseomonas oryziterrae TaxID=2911368 RepID=UPI001F24C916|nr:tripartite tricarboxylate transporter substrate binding protein [Roseomonas sp. NPKOSM-4]